MSDYTITAGGSTVDYWVSRNAQGEIVEEEIDRSKYVVPPADTYRLRFKRFAKPFEMPKAEKYGGGTQTMTRLELEIVGGKGNGKKAAVLVGWAFGPRAAFGRVMRACERREIETGEEVDLFGLAEKEFSAYLQPSDDKDPTTGKAKYANMLRDTIKIAPDAADDGDTWDDEERAA